MTDHLEPTLEADPLLTSLPVENNTNRAWGKLESLHPGVKDLSIINLFLLNLPFANHI
jgi:hypothetical protein